MTALNCELHTRDRVTVIEVEGDVDAATAATLGGRLIPLVENGAHVVVELSRVPFMGVAGVELLLRARELAEPAGGSVSIATPPVGLRRLIDRMRLHDALPVTADIADAIASLGRRAVNA